MKDMKDTFAAWYVTAYLDALGIREALSGIPDVPGPLTSEQMSTCTDSLFRSYEIIKSVRDGIEHQVNTFGETNILHTISPEKRDLFLRIRHTDIRYRFFSDSITLYQCLRNDLILVPMGAVFGILGACGSALLTGIINGHPIRGGIEIGLGVEIDENDIYGHTLAEAYRLESKVAHYPRLVIGKRLLNWINAFSSRDAQDEASTLNQKLASLCRSMIFVDHDSTPVLDYLGEGFVAHVSRGLGNDVYAALNSAIDQNIVRFEGSNESALGKWQYLKQYFLSRQGLWKSDKVT